MTTSPARRPTKRRCSRAGETSMISAMINPTIVHSDQTPPNQCSTTVYHSSVVGKKRKPSTGHSDEVNNPSNHVVSTHSSTMAMRGVRSATIASSSGMSLPYLVCRSEPCCFVGVDRNLDTAIPLTAGIGIVRRDRLGIAASNRRQASAIHAHLLQETRQRLRAAFRQTLIAVRPALRVGMAHDHDARVGILLEAAGQAPQIVAARARQLI